MVQPSLHFLQSAVQILGLCAVGLAIFVYLLMEFRYRGQLHRSARRLILSSKLFPSSSPEELRALWSRSRESDRELIEDLLADVARSSKDGAGKVAGKSIIELGILDRWIRDLQKGRTSRRVRAAVRLGFVNDARAVYALAEAAKDSPPELQLAITLSLGRLKDSRGLPGLLRIASDPPGVIPDLTLAAALADCGRGSPDRLVGLLRAKGVRQRIIGAWALSEVAERAVLRNVISASRDPEPEVRAKVVRALGRISDPGSKEALLRLVRDPVWFVRVRALDALGKLRDPSVEDAIWTGLKDEVREVRYRAAAALRELRGMMGDTAAKVLAGSPRGSFDSLISEWDRAGFLWQLVGGLSTRDWPRYVESRDNLKVLIAAGVTRPLVHFVTVYPDVKVRLRLVQLLKEKATPAIRAELTALAEQPHCDPRVAAAVRQAFPQPESVPVAGVNLASA